MGGTRIMGINPVSINLIVIYMLRILNQLCKNVRHTWVIIMEYVFIWGPFLGKGKLIPCQVKCGMKLFIHS